MVSKRLLISILVAATALVVTPSIFAGGSKESSGSSSKHVTIT